MKICGKCKIKKHKSEFGKDSRSKDKLYTYCKDCMKKANEANRRTKNGVISNIYGRQKYNSKKRGHEMPTYTKKELEKWLYNETSFIELYNKWVKSDYKKELYPSVDRLDDYKGYSLDNIQLIIFEENRTKSHNDRKNGINNKDSKSVIQLDLNGKFIKEFYSIREAERQTGIYQSNICKCCNNIHKTAGGYVWKYKITQVSDGDLEIEKIN